MRFWNKYHPLALICMGPHVNMQNSILVLFFPPAFSTISTKNFTPKFMCFSLFKLMIILPILVYLLKEVCFDFHLPYLITTLLMPHMLLVSFIRLSVIYIPNPSLPQVFVIIFDLFQLQLPWIVIGSRFQNLFFFLKFIHLPL